MKYYICALRGRKKDNKNKWTQSLEINYLQTSNTLTTVLKDNYVLCFNIKIKNATKQGYIEAHNGDGIDLAYPNSKNKTWKSAEGGIQTLETNSNLGTMQDYIIRKLTPREYWRLMAFTDDDFDKAQAIQSDSQLYKEAGNSIVVSVLEGIFTNLIELDNNLNRNS